MFTKTQESEDRLRVWREFRQDFPEDGTQQEVLDAFKSVHIRSRYLDYFTPSSWPGIFEIVSEGYFCQTGLNLVIAGTLEYLGFIKSDTYKFDVISNYLTGQEGAYLIYKDMYYNFIPGEIVSSTFAKSNSHWYNRGIITIDKF